MKKLTLLVVCVCLFSRAYSQTSLKTSAYYLQKSKKQKTAAWILLIAGAAAGTTALLVGSGEETSFDEAGSGAVIGGIGLLSMAGSIPLFIASKRNKNKSVNLQAMFFKPAGNFYCRRLTAGLSLSFPL